MRRISDEVLSTAVRGLEIELHFDESFFEGTSVYLLAAVLERFFRKYVTINSFTETCSDHPAARRDCPMAAEDGPGG